MGDTSYNAGRSPSNESRQQKGERTGLLKGLVLDTFSQLAVWFPAANASPSSVPTMFSVSGVGASSRPGYAHSS